MSKHTPTPGEAFEATLYTWVDWKGRYRDEEEARAAWERMIAEVERAAADKAWVEGAHAQWRFDQIHLVSEIPVNPYRRNEGEISGRSN